jgi:hypothetical protein
VVAFSEVKQKNLQKSALRPPKKINRWADPLSPEVPCPGCTGEQQALLATSLALQDAALFFLSVPGPCRTFGSYFNFMFINFNIIFYPVARFPVCPQNRYQPGGFYKKGDEPILFRRIRMLYIFLLKEQKQNLKLTRANVKLN